MQEKYKQHCYDALKAVLPTYFSYKAVGTEVRYGERVFAYEFYHQLRLSMPPSDLNLTGEPVKGLKVIANIDETISPDFVIHKFDTNQEDLIAIEVKSHPRTELQAIRADLQKLGSMLLGGNFRLHYKLGLFIIINYNLIQRLKNFRNTETKQAATDIIDLIKKEHRIEVWNIIKPEVNQDGIQGMNERQCNVRSPTLLDSCIIRINSNTIDDLLSPMNGSNWLSEG